MDDGVCLLVKEEGARSATDNKLSMTDNCIVDIKMFEVSFRSAVVHFEESTAGRSPDGAVDIEVNIL